MIYNRTLLDNGLRVVTEQMPYVKSVSLGVWVEAGSRYEMETENGICHFIEHMTFKGTKTRTARDIAFSLESRGGTLNAFTARESTCYYAKVLNEDFNIAIDVLADILTESLFDEEELDRERKVIIEEIKDIFDSPAELIHDYFASTVWQNHPLGRPIIGDANRIGAMQRSDLINFINRNYTANRIIVAAAGSVDHQKLVDMVKDRFTFEASEVVTPVSTPDNNGNMRRVIPRDSQQTHICLGVPSLRFTHPKKYAVLLLNTILGSGMASRLFQSVRERHGLAYSIYSYHDFYDDLGLLGVYLGTKASQAVKAINLVLEELRGFKDNCLSEAELSAGKSQFKGSITLALEGSYSRMIRLAKLEASLKRYVSLDQVLKEIDAVTIEDVNEVANDLLREDRLSMAALGPVDEKLPEQVDWSVLKN